MDKFIYGVCNTKKHKNKIVSIMANSINDAKDRIVRTYFDQYEDLEEDDWDFFIDEIDEKYGIIISDVIGTDIL